MENQIIKVEPSEDIVLTAEECAARRISTRALTFTGGATSSEGISIPDKEKYVSCSKFPAREGINWVIGGKIEARDYLDKWYPSKIVEIDVAKCSVLVHFDGWNSRYDEWLPMISAQLRPIRSPEESADSPCETQTPPKSRSKFVAAQYKIGMYVFAKWTDGKMYPARVVRECNSDHLREVLFYDGIKKRVEFMNLRAMDEQSRAQYSEAGLLPGSPKKNKKRLSQDIFNKIKLGNSESSSNQKEEGSASPSLANIMGVEKVATKAFTIHQDHNEYKCTECSKSFRKQTLLNSHIKHYHNDGVEPTPPDAVTVSTGVTAPVVVSTPVTTTVHRTTINAVSSSAIITSSASTSSPAALRKVATTTAKPTTIRSTVNMAKHKRSQLLELSDADLLRLEIIKQEAEQHEKGADTKSIEDRAKGSVLKRMLLEEQPAEKTSKLLAGKHHHQDADDDDDDDEDEKPLIMHKLQAMNKGCSNSSVVKNEPVDIQDDTIEEEVSGDNNSDETDYEGEIIHCICGYQNDSGMMVKCDSCQCWQHMTCMVSGGVVIPSDSQQTQYTCYNCDHAKDKREEMKNSHDQTYIKLGRMATFANMPDTDTVTRKADIVAATNELMSCLHVSGNALKSTRAKIDIIRLDAPELKSFGPVDDNSVDSPKMAAALSALVEIICVERIANALSMPELDRSLRVSNIGGILLNEHDEIERNLDLLESQISVLENGLGSFNGDNTIARTLNTLIQDLDHTKNIVRIASMYDK